MYSAVVRAIVETNYSVSGITIPGIASRCRDLGAVETDGRWTLPRLDGTASTTDFVSGYLVDPNTHLQSADSAPPNEPIDHQRIAGGPKQRLLSCS